MIKAAKTLSLTIRFDQHHFFCVTTQHNTFQIILRIEISQLTFNVALDQLVEIVEGYRQRKYNEDMMAIEGLGGKKKR